MLRIAAVLSIAAAAGYGLGEITDGRRATASVARPEVRNRIMLPPVIVASPSDGHGGPAAAGEYAVYR